MSEASTRTAICPGTYDPVTYGHVDVIERAARLFDRVVVSVVVGSTRKRTLFTADERASLVRKSVHHLDNVEVQDFNSLVIEHAQAVGALVVVKGLRAISDFDYEFQMAQINRHLDRAIDTVYLPASPQWSFLSSSGVREVAAWGGNVDDWVPPHVADALRQRHLETARTGS